MYVIKTQIKNEINATQQITTMIKCQREKSVVCHDNLVLFVVRLTRRRMALLATTLHSAGNER